MPVVSANTQARLEGYFRLEWKLAEDRSHLMAKGKPFIVPVCIDATPERDALVPDAFLHVQWTRLTGGETPPAFVERVKRLFVGGVAPASSRLSQSAGRMPALLSDPRIPDYELIRKIGSGGYGDVWLARGLTGVYRAIKIVWRDRFADAEPFEREFNGLKKFTAMALPEASQLGLLHVGQNEGAGFFYYVMELADDVQGGRDVNPATYAPLTLKEVRARRGRLPAAECVTLGIGLARALAGLHERGLVHRDIKPSNVILVGGVPKLADIGLVATAGEALTQVGTPGFVPPEGPGRARADVYALGRLLYELATGLDREEFPRLPAQLGAGADRKLFFRLNAVILRACEPEPAKRQVDAAALLADLLELEPGSNAGAASGGSRADTSHPWLRVIMPLAGVALSLIFMFKSVWKRERRAEPKPPAVAPVPPQTSEKSVVVLPLENLSPDPANAFFTDGMHAEIIATLSRLPDVKVTSRATAQQFKAPTKSLSEIARQLGVAHVVTGSVRREGTRVRVVLEMRRAGDDALLWQRTFDRELAQGFALQDEIAAEVARVLQVRTDQGWYAGARFMTKNPAAYELFLRAREIPYQKGPGLAPLKEQAELCEQALKLDPEFMSAASLASSAYAYMRGEPDPVKRKANAERAKAWAERASQLMPGGAGDGALAVYYLMIERDAGRALGYAENEARALPNDPNGHNRVAVAITGFGRYREAVEAYARAMALDPLNVRVLHNRVIAFAHLRRTPEFEAAAARSLEYGGRNVDWGMIAQFRVRLTGAVPAEIDPPDKFLNSRFQFDLLLWARRYAELLTVVDAGLQKRSAMPADLVFDHLLARAQALRLLGRGEEALAVGREMLGVVETQQGQLANMPDEYERQKMWALACAGQPDEALRLGRHAVELAAKPAETVRRWELETQLAQVCGWFGRTPECVGLLAPLLRQPSLVTVPYLRLAPDWDKVRADPAFQALLNDAKNSQPL